MEVFRKILEKLTRVDLRDPEDLISIYKEILDEFIKEIHLISYFNVFNTREREPEQWAVVNRQCSLSMENG